MENAQPKSYRKGKKESARKLAVEEPVRTTLYDIVVENLRLAGRKTFLHRFIYVGRHTFPTEFTAITFFEKTINTNGIEPITGLYLHYKHHFLHVIETDEDSIQKHLNLLYESEEFADLQDLKLLGDLNHINSRLNYYWSTYIGTPKVLVNAPDQGTMQTPRDTAIQVFNCINKINRLVHKMYGESSLSVGLDLDHSNASMSDVIDQSVSVMLTDSKMADSSSFSMTQKSSILGAGSPYRDFLPERELLDYLIDSPYTQDLRMYTLIGSRFVQNAEYDDHVWPIPEENVQYDIMTKDVTTMGTTTLQGYSQAAQVTEDRESGDEDDIIDVAK